MTRLFHSGLSSSGGNAITRLSLRNIVLGRQGCHSSCVLGANASVTMVFWVMPYMMWVVGKSLSLNDEKINRFSRFKSLNWGVSIKTRLAVFLDVGD
ncbi:hypothetical protein TNIN_468031 [Trichonephila inaurata madagascariensis]|uniref:Uncharacterized protein n=1 Tax=Trichonephila inaurata madagascariensis TaxID=2747483 RepID=A0A8X6JS55_9ARAC|nr:hypothetical protein TNIN_468031 [Trichonephila inaurata madagascariensis]